jgi:hypothetical protein
MTKRSKYLMKNYGITEEQYLAQLKKQKDCCGLCGKHKSHFSYNLHQDHDHKTGKNRGILCFYCNKYRVARHNLESAEALYAYMVEHE